MVHPRAQMDLVTQKPKLMMRGSTMLPSGEEQLQEVGFVLIEGSFIFLLVYVYM